MPLTYHKRIKLLTMTLMKKGEKQIAEQVVSQLFDVLRRKYKVSSKKLFPDSPEPKVNRAAQRKAKRVIFKCSRGDFFNLMSIKQF